MVGRDLIRADVDAGSIEGSAVQHQSCLGGLGLLEDNAGGFGAGIVIDGSDPMGVVCELLLDAMMSQDMYLRSTETRQREVLFRLRSIIRGTRRANSREEVPEGRSSGLGGEVGNLRGD